MREEIAKRYTRALFKSASLEEIERYLVALKNVEDALVIERFRDILESSDVAKERKVALVLSLLDNSEEKLVNFVKILFEKKRVEIVPEICSEIAFEISKQKNIYEGKVISQKAITNEIMQNLKDGFSKKIGADINLSQEVVDFEGIKLTVDDLGLEVGFSKERLKQDLANHIIKAI